MHNSSTRLGIFRVLKYGLIVLAVSSVYYLFNLIPGSSPLKYIASVITIVALCHATWKDYREAKSKGEKFVINSDKWFLAVGLLVAFGASVRDDVTKYHTDKNAEKKNLQLAKAQNDLAQMTVAYTRRTATDVINTNKIATKTKTDTTLIKTDTTLIRKGDTIIRLDQKVLTALAQQNIKMARQNALEQLRASQQQKSDAQSIRFITQAQAERTRDADKSIALHNDVKQASRTVHSLNQTLYGLQRTLNPIQDVRMTCLINIPLDNPDPRMQAYKALLDKAVKKFYSSPSVNPGIFTEVGGFYVAGNGGIGDSRRLVINRGSTLYSGDEKTFPTSLYSKSLKIGIWHKTSMLFHKDGSKTFLSAQPDMEMETTQYAVPELWYYPSTKMLTLAFQSVAVTVDKNSEKVISIPDLDGATVVVTELNYDFSKQSFSDVSAGDLQDQCRIWRVAFVIANHDYIYNMPSFSYSQDSRGWPITYFTFDGKKSLDSSNATSPEFWDIAHKR